MNFSWCQVFMNCFYSGEMIESYLFETDGIGLVFSLLPFAALMFVLFIHVLEKNGGGKNE